MKNIAYLAIITILTSTTNNYGLEWDDLTKKLLQADRTLGNILQKKDYKKFIQDPTSKIIYESAKNKEQQIDAEIIQINKELSVLNNLSQTDIDEKENKRKTLEQEKKVFHNITTTPNIYLEFYYGERKYIDGKHDLEEEFEKIHYILAKNNWEIIALEDKFYKKYPIRDFPEKSSDEIDQIRIELQQGKRTEQIKGDLSNTLSSSEKYQELLSQGE
jgi:hypothetical protein